MPAPVASATASRPAAPENVIRVPDDYATIQAAIDAAQEGDTIQVVAGGRWENLTVTKGITLSGGWSADFTTVTTHTVVAAQGRSRVITITAALSTTTVTIDHFNVQQGDATGLSGLTVSSTEGNRAVAALALAPPARASAADWAADAVTPEDLARYPQLLALRGRLAVEAESPATAPVQQASAYDYDCGGGIFSENASLRLLNSILAYNKGSTNAYGRGGGLCVVGAPTGGIVVRNTRFYYNTGSKASNGAGGGVFVADTAPGALIFENNVLDWNTGSEHGPGGYGGGMRIDRSAGPRIAGNRFVANVALEHNDAPAVGDMRACGGALWIWDSDGAILAGNQFHQNIASSSIDAHSGHHIDAVGGAVYIQGSDGVTVRDNDFYANVGAMMLSADGGGLFLSSSHGSQVVGNTFRENWASYIQRPGEPGADGGGMSLASSRGLAVVSNTVTGNYAVFRPTDGTGRGVGGGVSAEHVDDFLAASNVISGNVAVSAGAGWAGGLAVTTYLGASQSSRHVTLTANLIENNTASLAGQGAGGGAWIYASHVLIQGNRISGNRASQQADGAGGGVAIVPWHHTIPAETDVRFDGNLILDNQAGAEVADSIGGGLFISKTQGITLTNNVIARNGATAGGGIALLPFTQPGLIVNNTLVDNGDVALQIDGTSGATSAGAETAYHIVNNTIVSHSTGIQIGAIGAAVEVRYNLYNGNGADIISTAPITHSHAVTGPAGFADPAGNYRLLQTSAARDAGDPAGVPPAPVHDADGVARPFGPRVDIGAYEWHTTTLRVPDDYAAIQAAIDAAVPGSLIQVRAGLYPERLSIGKAITLSGGWDAGFAQQTPGASAVDAGGLGRVVSITTPASTTVVIDGFTITNGDATGQGGLGAAALAGGPLYSVGVTTSLAANLAGTGTADVRAMLSSLAARGLMPGGLEAYRRWAATIDRLDHLAGSARGTVAAAPGARTPSSPQNGLDCGGGIYSAGASLQVRQTEVVSNVASQGGDGYGGGICAISGSGVVIEHSAIRRNTASQTGNGMGGGVYLGAVPRAQVRMNLLEDNVAARSGEEGFGGGLAVYDSPELVMYGNAAARNAANTAPEGKVGAGGGAYLMQVDEARIEQNTFFSNTAALSSLLARGGGLGVYAGEKVVVLSNVYAENLAARTFRNVVNGGGLSLDGLRQASVVSNTLAGNVGSLAADVPGSSGGGLYGIKLADSQISGNALTGNMASPTGGGEGGGAYLEPATSGPTERVTIADNTFIANAATLTGQHGLGGGLGLYTPDGYRILRNRFQANRASVEGMGGGGGMRILGMFGAQTGADDVVVDGNIFIDNAASLAANTESFGGALSIAEVHSYALMNNVIAGNRADAAGGAYLVGGGDDATTTGAVINNTFVGNAPSSLELYGWFSQPITLVNNIVVSHAVGISVTAGSLALASYTLWNGNGADVGGPGALTGTHPVTGPAAFANPAAGNYRLALGSAARDAGDPAGVPPAPGHDAEGVSRPQGPRVDIGAHELRVWTIYLPLVSQRWPLIGWAVGDAITDGQHVYGTILRTIDGGITWARQGTAAEIPDTELKEVSAVDASNAWVVGAHEILRTRDGGQTWQQQTLPPGMPAGFELMGIKALSADTVYVVGMPAVLLQTTNGITWTHMPRGADITDTIDFQVVDAIDAAHVWAVGGTIVETQRRQPIIAFYDGVEWRLQSTSALTAPTTAVIGVSAIDALHAWAVGGFGMPLATTADGGATWQVSPYPLSAGDMNRVVAVDAVTGWAAGDYGNVKHTTDAGATWADVSLPSAFLFGVTALDSRTAWVVGPGVHGTAPGIIARTVDAVNWEVLSEPGWPNMNGISFVGARR